MAKNDVILLDSLIEKTRAEYLRAKDGSELFELFAFDQLLKDFDLSLDDLEEGWTDGSNDGGIDGFFIFIDGQSVDHDAIEGNVRREPTLSLHIFTCRRSETFISREGENYVVLAPLPNYFDFVSDEEGKLRRYLFDSNVRDFLGFGRVSTDILDTLKRRSNPSTEDFWWLNNGITILATHATVIGKDLAIENVQIVNGLQTTETIHEYFSSGGEKNDQRAILIKVILSADEATRARIVKATNYQNAVEISAIRGLDKIQFDIEQVLLDRG